MLSPDPIDAIADKVAERVLLRLAPKASNETFTAIDLWRAYDARNAGPAWWEKVRSLMRRPLAAMGTLRAADLSLSWWERLRDGELSELAPASRNQILKRIRAMLRWGLREGLIGIDPLAAVRRERQKKHRKTEVSEDDEGRVLETAPPAVRALFILAIEAGLRRTEMVTCRREWVDLERGTLMVWGDTAKTRQGRIVGLTARAVVAVRQHLATVPPKLSGSPWLFPSPAGGGVRHMSTGWATHNWWLRARMLGLRGHPDDGRPTLHDLRRTAASRSARDGATIPQLQAQFGWESPAQAAAYIRATSEDAIALRDLRDAKRRGPMSRNVARAPTNQRSSRLRSQK